MGRRKGGRAVSGWLILDKPAGIGSTEAVGKVRWLFGAKKTGHAGTLDPLASGMLPLALGDATRTVPHVMEGTKVYEFEVTWGERRSTDDAEGEAVERSAKRPSAQEIEACLPSYIGEIKQVPPAFSAIKVGGDRAYDLARSGHEPKIGARTVWVGEIRLLTAQTEKATFTLTCGKGTYVRSIARDLGSDLACLGYVSALRRISVAPFTPDDLVSWDELLATEKMDVAERHATLDQLLLDPVEALEGQPCVQLTDEQATRVLNGNPALLRGRSAPLPVETAHAVYRGRLVALGRIGEGAFHPNRVFPQT